MMNTGRWSVFYCAYTVLGSPAAGSIHHRPSHDVSIGCVLLECVRLLAYWQGAGCDLCLHWCWEALRLAALITGPIMTGVVATQLQLRCT
jgi:hypothetical protein